VTKEVDMPQNGTLNIAFLTDSEIQELNKSYRGKDKSTDVLSFHYFDDFTDVSSDEVAGEIILSESHILTQAKEYNHTPRKECEILIIHSILHILGFDHEADEEYEEMWGYEEKLR
jgi:probable rRNA maturation factor